MKRSGEEWRRVKMRNKARLAGSVEVVLVRRMGEVFIGDCDSAVAGQKSREQARPRYVIAWARRGRGFSAGR